MKWIRKEKKIINSCFGLIAGIIGGLTNVMASILIIYSFESKHTKKRLSNQQIYVFYLKSYSNYFFTIHGSFNEELLIVSFFFSSLIVVLLQCFGLNIKDKFPQEFIRKW